MVLRELEIYNFRIFPNIRLIFTDGINIISGLNGQGKTSILEAIYYLSLTKSFRTSSDNQVISYNQTYFNIIGHFKTPTNKENKIRIYYSNERGKHLFVNKKEVNKFSDYIGIVPCVVLTPDDLKLTLGGPFERRRFMDILISQISPVYLQDLKIYRRALQQRNSLLNNDDKKTTKSQIKIWDEQLIEHGSRIIEHRQKLIKYFDHYLSDYYQQIAGTRPDLKVNYYCNIKDETEHPDLASIRDKFSIRLNRTFEYDYNKTNTLTGPHRDDIRIYKRGKLFRDYCSQGENKTLVIALKFLEWDYISKERDLKPILLLDDIFGELDLGRMQGLLNFLEKIGQAYITTTLQEKFDNHTTSKKFIVKEKAVYES